MITIIVAVSTDGYIGKDGKIPWRLKSDMTRFQKTTEDYTVVMGRKTWNSLDDRFRPLPKRRNIVLTRSNSFSAPGAEVVHSLEEALRLTENDQEVFIIGGEEVYLRALHVAERILLTRVNKTVGDGDARFPVSLLKNWRLVSRQEGVPGEKDECGFAVEDYTPNLRFIELANVRTLTQLKEYRLIRERRHCPFCPENLKLYHDNPILREGDYWFLTESDYPYVGTDTHLLLILKEHAETFGALPSGAQLELFTFINAVEAEGKFAGGGLCARAGDPLLSGASVKHLHFHLIAPTKEAEPTKFFMGKGKR